MLAIVTGASSGIGYEICKYLSKKGYDIIAVARDKEKLEKLENECTTKVEKYIVDLSKRDEVIDFYENVKEREVDVLVNNAGFGAFGNIENIEMLVYIVNLVYRREQHERERAEKGRRR